MRIVWCFTIVVLSSSLLTAAPQASAPAKVGPRATPAATPTSTSASPPGLPQTVAPALAGPRYSPAQIDFGTVDYNASSRRTFSLTAPSGGEITLQFPKGLFEAVELRRVPPPAQGGKILSSRALAPPMKPAPSFAQDFYVLYKWNFVAGEEMQLDILFTPNKFKDASPGPRTGENAWAYSWPAWLPSVQGPASAAR